MALRDDLLTPIPGANPSGLDLRYDPVIDKIREARREELEAPQGAWKTAIKVADYPLVIKLAGEILATRSKNLQIAAWLVDAHVRREGFGALASCFRFLRSLCEEFWDSLYPEIEDGDLEMRAAPLDWLGSKLDEPIRLVPITANGFTWFRYKESRVVGTEAEANTNDKRKARQQAITDGKLTAEEFDAAVDETPKQFCEIQLAAVEEARAALEELISFLDESFRDVSPSFTKVRTALEDNAHLLKGFISRKGGQTIVSSPEPAAPEPVAPPSAAAPTTRISDAPAPAVVPQAAPAPVQSPTAQPPGSLSAEPVDFEDAVKRVAGVARFLRAKDAYDISPYLILRGLRWGEIRYNGSDIDRSMLTAPDDQLRTDLAYNLSAGQWDKVLALTEQTMETACGRGWLDLQRYTVKALEGKGQWFASVAQAVRSGVRGLVTDLPALLDMSLRDGSPAADSETRAWIETEVLAGALLSLQPPAAPAPVHELTPEPAAPEPPPLPPPPVQIPAKPPQIEWENLSDSAPSDIFDEALIAAKAGNVPEALRILNRQLASERSGRSRFRRRVQLAHLLIATGHPQIAQPVLDEVAREIDSRKLEEWEEGDALAYPLSLLLQCANGDPERKSRLYAAVCRLDPVRALQITV